ncbi:hypothetical protein EGR_10254 [Echinococcus granulosus]|uniref:Uncharacterized protein n=1 Tax=Echinococcus granulosus TaxID=6210 RepID=W6U1G8_ECHGR|nr:hypothetical protein EGR_10254 [Echinococcus granulosus]EUB54893.1 hypothetical protein EGR_10254 [Echinococcus granulosus]
MILCLPIPVEAATNKDEDNDCQHIEEEEEEEDSGLKEFNRCVEDAPRCQIDYIEVVQQGDAQCQLGSSSSSNHLYTGYLPIAVRKM